MPQPNVSAQEDIHSPTGLPLIRVDEDSRTLDSLLRLCYPVDDPTLVKFSDIAPALKAATKYEMYEAQSLLKSASLSNDDKESLLCVYALACTLNFEDLAHRAALKYPQSQEAYYTPEMDQITSGAYFRFLQFLSRRPIQPTGNSHPRFHRQSLCRPPVCIPNVEDESWRTHLDAFRCASTIDRIILRSSDLVEFCLYKPILFLASAHFQSLFEDPQTGDKRNYVALKNVPVLNLEEDGQTLCLLLHFVYPLPSMNLQDIGVLTRVLDAAVKYRLQRAMNDIKVLLIEQARKEPLRLYFLAIHYGWEDEAKRMSEQLTGAIIDVYIPEMELVSAAAYRKLLVYRQSCRKAVMDVVHSLTTCIHQPPLYWSEVDPSLNPGDGGWIVKFTLRFLEANVICIPITGLRTAGDPMHYLRSLIRNFFTDSNKVGNKRKRHILNADELEKSLADAVKKINF
ncbi:uncharacterized protein FIBRA_08046 [Fibroporia radiculosa]|uniref:BTB domain-containing protein n=1 Tax=Fibroporia radiculosa TaxID=599839 RepID=J4I204_9APHY|nr:uncharacterized protein FIBRA_08046 [Fibroporia radiculosa]CCM05812.1 predicted protein [Fibroporia radiculosa]